ncbi:acyltransferase [Glaciihabitans arcticus]|uniref:Acyltransferase n=1 Tax=Glaciihabitans arcticus TaxID=2668039 RepID=A0A4Q9GS21_9MICO|nr:acyltransferase [Glaciihabitans arcticus]TBN56914.1 acyltransferase [Glaciihabitans arcticus]
MTSAPPARTNSLAGRFDPRHNSLNALRLLLAALVIVSHSWPLSGNEPEPNLGGANLGTWAVFGFFGISGFLIARSRLSGRPPVFFYRARALRILPAFLVCLVVVAFVFAPLSLLLDPAATWNLSNALSFVLRNLALYPPYLFQGGIAGTLTTTPFVELWNGPLWTLFWEACCYVAIGVLVSLVPKARLGMVLVSAFAVLTVVAFAHRFALLTLPELLARPLPLFLAFIAGSLVLLYAGRILITPLFVGSALAIVVVAVLLGIVPELGTLPLAYLLLVLGTALPLQKVGSRFDVSYGVYIYGWPVQQLIALALPGLPLPLFILLALAVTLPLAWLSCALVERPALALKAGRSPQMVATDPESTR